MIAETVWVRKKTNNEPTCCPRGMRRSRPKHEIDRYVYISARKECRCLSFLEEMMHQIGERHVVSFFPVLRKMAGRFLVFVFAATCKDSVLLTNQRACRRHVGFRLIRFGKTIVYGIMSHDSIKTQQKST